MCAAAGPLICMAYMGGRWGQSGAEAPGAARPPRLSRRRPARTPSLRPPVSLSAQPLPPPPPPRVLGEEPWAGPGRASGEMVSQLSPLQRELLGALLASGLARDGLLRALDDLLPHDDPHDPPFGAVKLEAPPAPAPPPLASSPEGPAERKPPLPRALPNGHARPGAAADDEASEDGDDFDTPQILRELQQLDTHEAAEQRAEVERMIRSDPHPLIPHTPAPLHPTHPASATPP